MDNIYLALTREMNEGRLRAVISSGQAVVLHRLAVMSKDGDWILREDEEALGRVLSVLAGHGARYRFGAPLDARWLRGGWSAHFEFRVGTLRVRTDFVSRPPRLSDSDLAELWKSQEGREIPVVGARHLVELKKTDREKDYAVIGELARLFSDPGEGLLCSRSARDLAALAAAHPALAATLAGRRPLLSKVKSGREVLEAALDAERRALMHSNEKRLACYAKAADAWAVAWPEISREIDGLALPEAHRLIVRRAEGLLPFALSDRGNP